MGASRRLLLCVRVLFRGMFLFLSIVSFCRDFRRPRLLFNFVIFTTCTCSQNYRTLGLLLSIIVEFLLFIFILVVNLTWSPLIFVSSLIQKRAMRPACYWSGILTWMKFCPKRQLLSRHTSQIARYIQNSDH